MKKFYLLLAAALLALAPDTARAAELAFTRWGGDGEYYVWHFDTKSGKESRRVKGYDPEIHPAGGVIVYTRYDKDGGRRVAFCSSDKKTQDAASGYIARKMKEKGFIPNDYGARWSPDGRWLLFSRFADGERWTPVILSPIIYKGGSTPEFSPAAQNGADGGDFFSPFWSHDSKAFFVSDLNAVHRFSAVYGHPPKLEESIPFERILPSENIIISSATRFSVSADGSAWLFAAEAGGEECAFCAAAGNPANTKGVLFIYRPGGGAAAERVDTGGLCVADAAWLGSEIVFSAHSPMEKKSRANSANLYDIYRMKQGGKPRKIINNGQNVSASREAAN
ncbi:MAG: hypothetical protein Q4D58_03385 [Synergistaceae bacterium]|nr:hypothetical protein [Synergistaceae bacterium]